MIKRLSRRALKAQVGQLEASQHTLRVRHNVVTQQRDKAQVAHSECMLHAQGLAETIHTLTTSPEIKADTESAFLRGESSGRKKAAAGLHGQVVALEQAVQQAQTVLRGATQNLKGYTVDLTQ